MPCIPLAVRQEAGRKGGVRRTYQARARRFELQFTELTRQGRKLTKDGILDAFAAVYRVAYNRGLSCGLNRVKAAQKRAA